MPLTFGIIGAGKIGGNVARLVIEHGHRVVISGSRGPEALAGLVGSLGSAARAATPAEAARAADLVVLATPFLAYPTLPAAEIADKIVLDASTYYDGRDGAIPSLQSGETTPGEFMQAVLPEARIVRVFNNVSAHEIPRDARPRGAADRRAIPITGDHAEANAEAAALLDQLGFDVVDAGPLSESWRYDPFTPASGAVVDAEQLRLLLAAAQR